MRTGVIAGIVVLLAAALAAGWIAVKRERRRADPHPLRFERPDDGPDDAPEPADVREDAAPADEIERLRAMLPGAKKSARLPILAALAKLKDADGRALALLQEAAADPDEEVVGHAFEYLAAYALVNPDRAREVANALLARAQADALPDIRAAAVDALVFDRLDVGDHASIGRLLLDPAHQVRLAAVELVGGARENGEHGKRLLAAAFHAERMIFVRAAIVDAAAGLGDAALLRSMKGATAELDEQIDRALRKLEAGR